MAFKTVSARRGNLDAITSATGRARPVAIVLAVFALATAILFHRNFSDQNQMSHFLKNIMILGGLLQIVYFGAGPMSLDARDTRPLLSASTEPPH